MEATSHLLLLLRDGRRVFPLRRADLRHEVWKLDLRWLSGNDDDDVHDEDVDDVDDVGDDVDAVDDDDDAVDGVDDDDDDHRWT